MSNLVWPASMPYDTVEIFDESEYSDITVNSVNGIPTGPIAYIPFISPRGYGEDNELVYINSSRISHYGNPNLSKYGLSLYLAHRFLAGGGTVLGKRLVPPYTAATNTSEAEGKSYANIGISALVNVVPSAEGVIEKHEIKYIKTVINHADQNNKTLTEAFADIADDTIIGRARQQTETLYRLFIISSKAAGEYANNFAFKLSLDGSMNTISKENSWNACFYHFADNDDGSVLDKDMVFTFADDITYEGESMDPENVFDTYSENVVFKKMDVQLYNFMEAIGIDGSKDFLLSDTYVASSITWTVNHSALDVAIQLGGACPLVLGQYQFPGETESDKFQNVLCAAYDSSNDDMLLNKIRYPYQYMFAPTCDPNVVSKMNTLQAKRDITHVFYMTPCFKTYSAVNTYIAGATIYKDAMNDFRSHVYCEWAYWKDPYTGKKTLFPIQYALAYQAPYHWINAKGTPYAGSANFTITGFVSGTMFPKTSSDAQRIKNHEYRINTVEEDGYGYAVPYEQITGQSKISALSECNNSFILTDMIRIALKVSDEKRWAYLSNAEIDSFKKLVMQRISSELGSCYQNIDIICNRESVNGAGRNRIECYITVYFKDILKGVSYKFFVKANNS